LPISRWYEKIDVPALAADLLDWLVHNAHPIDATGFDWERDR
jgi:hypothetical protein